jgi:hypothetical protein
MTEMTDLTNLSTIFGKPGEGIHKLLRCRSCRCSNDRCSGSVISKLTNKSFPLIFAALIALGIGVHAGFGIPTALNKKIGLVPDVNSQKGPIE